MKGSVLSVLASLVDKTAGTTMPMLDNVRLFSDGSVSFVGVSRVGRLHDFMIVYKDPTERLPNALVPIRWFQTMAKQAGRRGEVHFGKRETSRVGALIGSVEYKVYEAYSHHDFPNPPPPDGTEIELSLVDWSKGGAVASALPFTCTDWSRQHIAGVYLGAEVLATDGHKLASRRPCCDMSAIGDVVPNKVVEALLKLVDRLGATAIRCTVGQLPDTPRGELPRRFAWFYLTLPGGASALVTTRLADGFPVAGVASVTTEATSAELLVDVDAVDLREVWAPFKKDFKLAIYPNGELLVWAEMEAGIGTTLASMPAGPPAVVFTSTIKPIAKALPKHGRIGVRVGVGAPCVIAGEVVMPVTKEYARLPDHVQDALADSFGVPRKAVA